MTAIRTLLAGIVDYAGLFPPAALNMPAAVRRYAEYGSSDDAWILGRFVVPAAHLEAFAEARSRLSDLPEWKVSALLGAEVRADIGRINAFNTRMAGIARVDTVEGRATTPEMVSQIAGAATSFRAFVEIGLNEFAPLLDEIASAGLNAKLRTGGVTADAFPEPEALVSFIRACNDVNVPFKATAGLHHAVRGKYRLTYDPDSPTEPMFGFLNVFLAAAFIHTGMSDGAALAMILERDVNSIIVSAKTIRWRDHVVSNADVRTIRDCLAISFGSCSFREPVDELRAAAIIA